MTIRFVTADDEQDADGFWYHKNPEVIGACPAGSIPDLNATTVGWRRHRLSSGVIVETIRLPDGFRWLNVGNARVSSDGRRLVREVDVPDTTEGNTLFDVYGYLYYYFIFRDGKRRIERVTA